MCTAGGLAWNVMLEMTGVRLELLTDPEQRLTWGLRDDRGA